MTAKQITGISWTFLISIVAGILIPAIIWGATTQSSIDVGKVNTDQNRMMIDRIDSRQEQMFNAIMAKQDVQNVTLTDIKIELQKLKDKNHIK